MLTSFESSPSRTGQAVALMRAGMDRPHTPDGDRQAQRLLCEGMNPIATVLPGIVARTRFFDEQVLAALDRGVRQVVICGAGYDDRALRFRAPGVRYFEVDHPGTQADKANRLRKMRSDIDGTTLVPADFRDDDIADVLAGCGHDAAAPTLFLAEGLLVYLDLTTGNRLLSGLRGRAATGSALVVSLATHRPDVDSARAVAVANARRPNGVREPWRTILPAATYRAVLPPLGWRIDVETDPATLEPDAPAGRTILVAAGAAPE